MTQKNIEFILLRQFSSYLAMAVFIIDDKGSLIFYNDPAERILGIRYAETGEMPIEKWPTLFIPRSLNGDPIPVEKLPPFISFTQQRMASDKFYIRSLQGKDRLVEILSFPVTNTMANFLGAVAFFQEVVT